MLLLMSTTSKITEFSVSSIVDNVDNDDENSWETFEGVVEKHSEIMLF